MKLSEWLRRERIKRSEFARRIGVTPSHVTGLCDGGTWPSRATAAAVERETNGAVKPNDFVADPEDPATSSVVDSKDAA